MCGIYGIMALAGARGPDPALLERMGDTIVHRGPDDSGAFVHEAAGIGMRRLSIIDLAGGHQPIANEDESIWVVCNGEIYNFQRLRAELEAAGHRFRTHSDTEVLVHLYEAHGDAFVERLEGMFGFALLDTRRRRLLVGRDPLGIKQIYYHLDPGRRLVFASEAKALFALPDLSPELDPDALGEYLSFGYVPAPRSMFRGVAKLPTGSLMVCEAGGCTIHRYWSLPAGVDDRPDLPEWARLVREQLERAVTDQMVSDVPLGAFLSGGIDSSAVVAMMARHSDQPIRTYSIGFAADSGGSYYNELPYARQVSELFATQHREIVVRPDVVDLLPRLLWHLDEPIGDTAFVTTYLVSEFARREVTVILSGVGGDELFGGYRRYLGEYFGAYYDRLPGWLRRGLLAPVARRLPADRHSRLLNLSRYARSFILAQELSPEERYRAYVEVYARGERDALCRTACPAGPDALDRAFAEADPGDPLRRLLEVDLATQMPDDLLMLTDKMSMATSLECRVPLLDQQLVATAARIPAHLRIHGRNLKHVLKHALADVLPKEILYRPKRGFGAPMGAWLKRELAPLLRAVLSRETVERRGLLNWAPIAETIAEHDSSRADRTDHLISLLNLELWCRLYLDGVSPGDLAAELREHTAP